MPEVRGAALGVVRAQAPPLLGIVDDVFVLPLLLRLLAKFAVPVTRIHIDPRSRDERVVSVQ
jgi:uncharacterized membrane protein YkvA (DUF1232 family)